MLWSVLLFSSCTKGRNATPVPHVPRTILALKNRQNYLMTIKTLLIDNYDSYTYNLYQLIAQINRGGWLGFARRGELGD